MVVERTQSNTPKRSGSARDLDLSGLEPVRRIPGRNETKADILIYRTPLGDVALKDYGPRSFLVRNLLGRWLVRREVRAYTAAGEIEGLPPFLGRVGSHALATRWVEGNPLASLEGRLPGPEVFRHLEAILERLHARGVALSDLHHRDVLVSDDGSVHVVDLATALVLGERPGRFRRNLFRRFRDRDRIALARLRARFTGGDEAEAIASVGAEAAASHQRWRRLKRIWDRLCGKHWA